MAASRLRFPLLGLAIFALLAGIWAGLLRLGWRWPVLQPTLPFSHGPLMVSGFLGTLIGLERAVALRARWMYLGPLLSGVGGLLMIFNLPGLAGPLFITLGSLGLLLVFGVILRTHRANYTLVMALGALAWVVGNILWMLGWPVFQIVLWWASFLILTIAGERLELGRLTRLSRRVELGFLAACMLFLVGLIVLLFSLDSGTRLAGVGLLALTGWLLRYDIARRTLRMPGLPRFVAACLLSGYIWLGFSGVLAVIYGGVVAGVIYDALLHGIFLGFVFSMIFGHAPIIFPAVLGVEVRFQPVFYLHLILLHLSLVLRFGGDLTGFIPARLWGGLFNGLALTLFLGVTAFSVWRTRFSLR